MEWWVAGIVLLLEGPSTSSGVLLTQRSENQAQGVQHVRHQSRVQDMGLEDVACNPVGSCALTVHTGLARAGRWHCAWAVEGFTYLQDSEGVVVALLPVHSSCWRSRQVWKQVRLGLFHLLQHTGVLSGGFWRLPATAGMLVASLLPGAVYPFVQSGLSSGCQMCVELTLEADRVH